MIRNGSSSRGYFELDIITARVCCMFCGNVCINEMRDGMKANVRLGAVAK